MIYAHATGTAVDQVGSPPALAHDGTRWWDLRTLDPATLAACDWYPVAESPRPADTPTDTHAASYALTGATVTQTWTARPWTPDELAAQAAGVQREADRLAVRAILDTINANLDEARAAKVAAQAVLDAVAPTNVAQAWTQIKAVARVVKDTDNALIGVAQGVKDLAKYVKDM